MATITELEFAEQFAHLAEIARARSWLIEKQDNLCFRLGLPAKDGTMLWLHVDCSGYPTQPPAWSWLNKDTGALHQPADTPKGSGFFHGSGRICAPWNRLAYKPVDPVGPHSDWELANWRTNDHTKACTTLAAMALRLAVELSGPRYKGRKG